MSRHATLSPEAEQKLRNQKRNSTISAIIISLLTCALIVAILFYIALSPLFKNTEEMVTYSSGGESEEPITKPEMTNEVEKKPSSPASSMAKVIAANTPSATAIPVPDVTVVEPSLDFGDGNDFGDGWGSGAGNGSGGGGGFSFFNQKVKAERVCYVIDYSGSMSGKKIELLKAELTKSITALPDSVDYQLIFFAGPVWVAGDEVTGSKGKFTIKSNGKDYEWITTGGAHGYQPKDKNKRQHVEWITSSKSQRKKSLEAIQNTKLVYGTIWGHPLEMALAMRPKPDVIFFMTDGSAGNDSLETAKRIGRLGKKEGIMINTIALMLPKAKEAMGEIAKLSSGVFTMVDKDGKAVEQKIE
ncbi:MAG: hypothetical protein ACI9E1_001250 [Cryomorphaceae bacterium]|jgi:hypothetical protein